MNVSISELFSINEDDKQEQLVSSYQDPEHDGLVSHQQFYAKKAATQGKYLQLISCESDSFNLGGGTIDDIHAQREQLKRIIKGSIIEVDEGSVENDHKAGFKLIYESHVKNISGYPIVTQMDKQRTTSFHEKLNGDEFKKESKGFLKKMQ